MARPILRLRGTQVPRIHMSRLVCARFNDTVNCILFKYNPSTIGSAERSYAYALLARLFTTVLELKSKRVTALQSRPISLVPFTDRGDGIKKYRVITTFK